MTCIREMFDIIAEIRERPLGLWQLLVSFWIAHALAFFPYMAYRAAMKWVF